MTNNKQNKSLFEDLWDRRFFQYLATYLGVTWGLIQFSEWAVGRYNFDEGMVDRVALLLFACLPAVIMLIYLHGRAGHDKWRPFEKILYPLNFILALGASFFLIDGQAQSTTREIQVQSESGDSLITRVIPKSEYTHRMLFFPLEAPETLKKKWYHFAIPTLVDLDVEQDMQWYGIRPQYLREEYEDYGYELGNAIPFSTQRKIASDIYCDYFTTGSLSSKSDGMLKLDLQIFRSKDGKEVYTGTLESKDIYGIADQVSKSITNKLSTKNIENEALNYIDLPCEDLLSANPDVVVHYTKAEFLSRQGVDFDSPAYQEIEKATQRDDNCGECHILKAMLLARLNQDGTPSAAKAVEVSGDLPELQQLRLKYNNYLLSNEVEKSIRLLHIWKDLYPQDVIPFRELISRYSASFNYVKAKKIVLEAMDSGHQGSILLSAANLFLKSNDIDSAEIFVQQYESKYPEKAKNKTLLGDIYQGKGDLAKAIEVYEKNSILIPGNITTLIKLSNIHIQKLDIDRGMEIYKEALVAARNFRDSIQIYQSMARNLINFGMIDEVEILTNESRKLYYNNYPKAAFITPLITAGTAYSTIKDIEKIDTVLAELNTILPPHMKEIFSPLISFLEANWKEDKESFPKIWEKARPIVASTSGETGVLSGDLILHYNNEDYEKALGLGQEFVKVSGVNLEEFVPVIARCYAETGKFKEGIGFVDKILISKPYHPIVLYGKFYILAKMNDLGEAKKLIPTIEKGFSHSHPDYTYYKEFQDLLQELSL